VVDRAVAERPLGEPFAALERLRAFCLDRLPLDGLPGLVAVDLADGDLAQQVVLEERQQVLLDRPVERDEGFLGEPLGLSRVQPLGRERVKAGVLPTRFGGSRPPCRRVPAPSAYVGERVGELGLGVGAGLRVGRLVVALVVRACVADRVDGAGLAAAVLAALLDHGAFQWASHHFLLLFAGGLPTSSGRVRSAHRSTAVVDQTLPLPARSASGLGKSSRAA